MLHLAAVIHLQVVVSSIDQIELNIQVELVKIILLAVNKIALEVDEVIVALKQILVLVVHIHGELEVTVGLHVNLVDIPALVQAESDRGHDEDGCEDQQTAHGNDKSIVRLENQITTLSDTSLSDGVLSDGLHEPV